ncbi:BTAD domain-containing putative transcriptional regulator [Micromonospora sp. URMC 103]|uniref:AfsR/SARP family transcriptional regulator n=1 Tax=Micromonospora sp. URMC 103 TaxID=3423406 RepID=UPI003F1BBBDA
MAGSGPNPSAARPARHDDPDTPGWTSCSRFVDDLPGAATANALRRVETGPLPPPSVPWPARPARPAARLPPTGNSGLRILLVIADVGLRRNVLVSGELRFEVLGPVRAWRGGAEVELGTPQQRAILAILLVRAGAVATPDQLISGVWGETAPRAAAGMIRSYISRLRRALGDGRPATVIRSIAGGYALQVPPGHLDLADFHHLISSAREARYRGDVDAEASDLRNALALWKGTPLSGVRGEYADQERNRLLHIRLAAIEDLAAADLELGRHVEAAAGLAPVVIEQPLRERARELLMLALYRSGRQAEALGVYQETQRLLADEFGLDPGPELQEMQRRILRSDPSLAAPAGPRPLDEAPVPRSPVAEPVERLAPLPPDLPEFTGRTDLLRRMTQALRPSDATVPVLGLTGLAGIGKTTLAVHVGHMIAANFPDGQFFVDLNSPAEPLPMLLRGVGVSNDSMPDSPHESARLWRSRTAGRRLLLVLDDARDLEQVRPLLPLPGGAAVIITARRRLFGLSCAHWLTLDALPEDDSLALLERLVGVERVRSEPLHARDLVRLTAGLPQVVHAVGARLVSRPGWSLATALKRLSNRGRNLEVPHSDCRAIESPYESALRDLSPQQARALRLLAVPDGPDFSLAAAAAALDVPVDEAESVLESLVDVHLLEPRAEDRYHYLSPVRGFARSRALLEDGQAECQAALARLSRFYLATLRNAVLATDPGRTQPYAEPGGLTFDTAETAQGWLSAEHRQLWATAAQAASIPEASAGQLADLIEQVKLELVDEPDPDVA